MDDQQTPPNDARDDEHLILDIDVEDVIDAFPHGTNEHPPSEADSQAPG